MPCQLLCGDKDNSLALSSSGTKTIIAPICGEPDYKKWGAKSCSKFAWKGLKY
jgi:hypothetical protein